MKKKIKNINFYLIIIIVNNILLLVNKHKAQIFLSFVQLKNTSVPVATIFSDLAIVLAINIFVCGFNDLCCK